MSCYLTFENMHCNLLPLAGHCKEFDPIYKKIAKKMSANNENIVFGKFDATSNDVPYMFPPLKGYPSIFFLSAYEKFDPIQYQGDRTYKSVKDWINRHSSIFLSEEERTGQAADDDDGKYFLSIMYLGFLTDARCIRNFVFSHLQKLNLSLLKTSKLMLQLKPKNPRKTNCKI